MAAYSYRSARTHCNRLRCRRGQPGGGGCPLCRRLGFVKKLLAQRRWAGHVRALPRGDGQRALLGPAEHARLHAAIRAENDASLAKLVEAVGTANRRRVSIPTMSRTLIALGLGRKKTFRAQGADEEERESFRALVTEMPHGRFLFVGETGMNTDLARRYGRVPKGERAHGVVPRNTPPNLSPAGAMGKDGIVCSMEPEGAIGGDAFLVFVKQVLGSGLTRSWCGTSISSTTTYARTCRRCRRRFPPGSPR